MRLSSSFFVCLFSAHRYFPFGFFRAGVALITLIGTIFSSSPKNPPKFFRKLCSAYRTNQSNEFSFMKNLMFFIGKYNEVFKVIVVSASVFMVYFCFGRVSFSCFEPPNNMSPKTITLFICSWIIGAINSMSSFVVNISRIPNFWSPKWLSSYKSSVGSLFCIHVISHEYTLPLTRSCVNV